MCMEKIVQTLVKRQNGTAVMKQIKKKYKTKFIQL